MATRTQPFHHPGHLDQGGHRLTMHTALECSPKRRGYLSHVASSNPPRTAAPGVPPECLLLVLLFDFGRRHGLRKGQHQGVAVVARGLAALLHVGLAFQHGALRGKYTLNRPHPNPSPVSGDEPGAS
jgi:hypothetical protein